ncbi:unnamed protein product [Rotaria sordida]|uniref:Uncharacterized protein n=1 Tax=Rotaria sordida TaxID=392033 RepID=A0A814GQ38_9BILA|nr:unnamed protein product [Rotaria sordida]
MQQCQLEYEDNSTTQLININDLANPFTNDFRSISKSNFHLMCEQYLPLIIDHVSSLCLSNGEETPELSEHLIHYCLTIDEFIHLRSLLLEKIDSADTILNITSDFFYLSYLTHLKIIKCHFTYGKSPQQLIIDIWRLINLTHCTLDITFEPILTFIGLPIISKELNHLLRSTPSLQHLCITFGQSIDTKLDRVFPIPLITTLKLDFNGSLLALTSILQNMPNLLHLKLETETINLNGNQWKQILIDYVPKIKIFRFLMKVFSFRHNYTEEQLEDFLDTFRTPFWLDEHQWFIRCNWPQHINKNQWSKTTCPTARDYNSYDRMLPEHSSLNIEIS